MAPPKPSSKNKKTPSELKKQMLSTIRKSLRKMNSPRWILTLETRPKAEQDKAAQAYLQLQQRKLRLENSQLEDIRDAMLANEQQIIESTAAMEKALLKLQVVADVLSAGANLIAVTDRILKIV